MQGFGRKRVQGERKASRGSREETDRNKGAYREGRRAYNQEVGLKACFKLEASKVRVKLIRPEAWIKETLPVGVGAEAIWQHRRVGQGRPRQGGVGV